MATIREDWIENLLESLCITVETFGYVRAQYLFRSWLRGKRTVLGHQLAQHPRIVDDRTGSERILYLTKSVTDVAKVGTVEAIEQRLVVDVVHVKLVEYARFDTTLRVHVKEGSAAREAASNQDTVAPEVRRR